MEHMEPSLLNMAEHILEKCRSRGLSLVTAESCTGGLIAATLTGVAGSSEVFDRGFVTYSNQAKTDMLGVEHELITQEGAVSELVARHMAIGALTNSGCDIAVAVTGVAGPGGGSSEKPVGTVHIAIAEANGCTVHEKCQFGALSRNDIRQRTVWRAFEIIDGAISTPVPA